MIQTFDFTSLTGRRIFDHPLTTFRGGPDTRGGIPLEHLSQTLLEFQQIEFAQKAQVISCLANHQALRSMQFFPTQQQQPQTWYIENHTGSFRPTYAHFFKPYADFLVARVPEEQDEVPIPTSFHAQQTSIEELEENLTDVQDEQPKIGLRQALLLSRDDLQTDTLAVTFRDEGILKTKVWSWIH